MNTPLSRPETLAEVAAQSASLEEFGRNLRDWLHSVRLFSSRPQLARAIADEPVRLTGAFADGAVADATLAAYAELVAARAGLVAPVWAFEPARILDRPWFAEPGEDTSVRKWALQLSPLPFKRRNLFAARVDLPLRLRAGRPAVSAAQKARSNAERQRRHRARVKAERKQLHALLRTGGSKSR
jgi:hypothetical protein